MDALAHAEVVTLGECLVSFVAATPGPLAEATRFERHVAGAEANVAVGLARLGHSVAYIGRVGADGFGTAIVRRLRGEGVDVTHLAIRSDARTGLMVRERRSVGAAEVVYHRAASAGAALARDDIDRAADAGVFDGGRWLHLTGITPALSETACAGTFRARDVAREAGLSVSLDVNLRRRLWSDQVAGLTLRDLAAGVDVVLGSPDELAVIAERDPASDPADLAAAITTLGPSTVIAKLAAAGALGLESGVTPVHVPGITVHVVVDPVGAGDAFCAGFIAGRLDGVDLEIALRMGNACGALAVAAVGDQAGLPDRAELGRLLAGGAADTLR
jgi:2-dehydro-3-deoxygluconokinase